MSEAGWWKVAMWGFAVAAVFQIVAFLALVCGLVWG